MTSSSTACGIKTSKRSDSTPAKGPVEGIMVLECDDIPAKVECGCSEDTGVW